MTAPTRLAPLLAALLLAPGPAGAQPAARRTVTVAAAANLKVAMEALASAFEAERPDADVAVTLGASGAFFAQIRAGAPFDLFFSADREYPRRLASAGLAAGDERVYAIGRLVVWAPKGSPLPLATKGLAALAGPEVKRIAIANPAVAPYGRAAEAALKSAGILEAVRARLVLGQSVGQAAQFATAGAADAAILPLSLTFAAELTGGITFELPRATFPPQAQSAVLLRGAPQPDLGRAFLDFVTGPRGRAILSRLGYALP